ncbi:MAG: pantetheine-phosphate adenylyltransferase [Candidatus Omnitrophica bacterium CG11_big_fil_rev_8_21_14_0_20_64_10]|nr:MAG: pantetheine-phosphate adenylyltransferase [Candidatus Omnitrophica bacterium CG11_big_fil_rev_8_21_14_0_20_64_10]
MTRSSQNQPILYPGSFDPVTNGHLDLIRRAAAIFPRVVVGVAGTASKEPLFPVEERVTMLKQAVRGIPRVTVRPFDGLVVDFARRVGARRILRGLRMVSDFEYEFQMALTNRKLNTRVETIFLMPSPETAYISSRLVKEVAGLGGDVSRFVPGFVARRLKAELSGPSGGG